MDTTYKNINLKIPRSLRILIKYFDPEMPKIAKLDIGDWVDLRTSEERLLEAGKYTLIKLGIAMQLPTGYEAIIAPRSSTFKNWGILLSNSLGVIDESYCGNDDQWMFGAYPTRDVLIEKYSRICQFRIQKKQPTLNFEEVVTLSEKSRGGFGSTGIK